jgi:hypothetical protein
MRQVLVCRKRRVKTVETLIGVGGKTRRTEGLPGRMTGRANLHFSSRQRSLVFLYEPLGGNSTRLHRRRAIAPMLQLHL